MQNNVLKIIKFYVKKIQNKNKTTASTCMLRVLCLIKTTSFCFCFGSCYKCQPKFGLRFLWASAVAIDPRRIWFFRFKPEIPNQKACVDSYHCVTKKKTSEVRLARVWLSELRLYFHLPGSSDTVPQTQTQQQDGRSTINCLPHTYGHTLTHTHTHTHKNTYTHTPTNT